MFGIDSNRLAALAAAFSMALAAHALAQSPAASHSHDASAPAKLALDHGKKWATDAPLRDGMTKVRALVEPRIDAAHAGKLTPAQYREIASGVEAQVASIVANCKLAPEADAMLHVVIAELGQGADTMAGKDPKAKPLQGFGRTVTALNEYARHFDHPGFKPINTGH
jgi:hypothetical protein